MNDTLDVVLSMVGITRKNQIYKPPNPTVYYEAPHHQCGSNNFVRLAGMSGGLAVAFAAFGAHFVNDNPDLSEERKRAMEYANRHHFLNSIGMVLASLAARRPSISATLFLLSTVLFCGPSYHYAITANKRYRSFTPVGGVLAMLAWFSFIL